MGVAKVKRILIVGHKDVKEKVLETLRDLSAIHIDEIETDGELKNIYVKSQGYLEKKKKIVEELSTIYNILKEFDSDKKNRKSFSEKIEKLLVGEKIPVSEKYFQKVIKNFDYEKVLKEVKSAYEKLLETNQKIEAIKQEIMELKGWEGLDIDLSEVRKLKNVKVRFFRVSANILELLLDELAEEPLLDVELLNKPDGDKYNIAVIFHKDVGDVVSRIAQKYNLEILVCENITKTVKHRISVLLKNLASLKDKVRIYKTHLRNLSRKYKKSIAVYLDFLTNEAVLEEVKTKYVLESSRIFLLGGWILEKQEKQIRETLLKNFKEIEIYTSEPKGEENPPVYLENRWIFKPYESIVTFLAYPNYKEIDPTPFIAPFFAISFATALTDAGYGLVLAILSAFLLRYRKILNPFLKNFLMLGLFEGIITIFMGIITGGFFGIDFEPLIAKYSWLKNIYESVVILDPKKDVLKFLGAVLFFGSIQVSLAYILKMVTDIRNGDVVGALTDSFPWFLIGLSVAIFILLIGGILPGKAQLVAIVIFLTGIGILVIFGGVKSKSILGKIFGGLPKVYNITSFMGDILSYSRLMALGLATGVIGLVVNVISGMLFNVPVIGWLFGIAVLIGGHILNLVINSLGGFVHSLRLQFLEFASKFFVGGGTPFTPFSKIRKYTYPKYEK